MADRTDFFYRQLVSEADLDEAFGDLETAVMRVLGDIGLRGVFSGLTVAETSPTGLEVTVTAGTARDQAGNRIRVPSTQTVDISEDYLGVPTTVATTGNQKYLSIYITFDRSLESPQTDGNGDTIYARRLESFAWKVVQGTESATPTRPALLSDAILLADLLISHGTTAVVNADLSVTRRMDAISIAGTPIALTTGNIVTALTTILTIVNAHIAGTGQYHPASVIQYNGSGTFANGSTVLSSGGVEAALDQLVTLLSGTSSDPAGEDLLGVRTDATQSPSLGGGTLRARLVALRLASNLVYGGSGNFADGNPIAAGTIEAAIDALVTALAGSTGLAKISGATITQSPTSITGASAQSMLAALLTAVNARGRIGSAETVTGAWGFNDITATSTNKYKLASRSLTRVLNTPPVPMGNGGTPTWEVGSLGATQVVTGGTGLLCYWIELPNGAELTAIGVVLKGANSHVGLPASMPAVELRSLSVTGTSTLIGTATDSSANTTAYQDYHAVNITGLSHTVDRATKTYILTVSGEGGGNALTGLLSAAVTATFTTTSMDDGAA